MNMERVAGSKIGARELPSYTWNADLVAYDGPFLSLFQAENGTDALFAWLDCDDRGHRWAIIPIGRDTLAAYLRREVDLLEVLRRTKTIVVYDQFSTARRNITRTTWQQLPQEYLPDPGSYLTPELATPEALRLADEQPIKYSIELDGELFIDDLSMIPRLYQQLYSFHYGLAHLDREAVRSAIVSSVKRWTGGISAVNLFSGLTSVMPSVHRPRVRTLQYASPGRIQLELLPLMAWEIRSAALRLEAPEALADATRLYKAIYSYFKDAKISGFEDDSVSKEELLTPEQIEVLRLFVEQYLELFGWASYKERFATLEIGPLPQLRALLAYFRRLRRLLVYQAEGLMHLTEPATPSI